MSVRLRDRVFSIGSLDSKERLPCKSELIRIPGPCNFDNPQMQFSKLVSSKLQFVKSVNWNLQLINKQLINKVLVRLFDQKMQFSKVVSSKMQ